MTPKHLFWCQEKIIKGYQPYRSMGNISNSGATISIEVTKDHRKRSKGGTLKLKADSEEIASSFVTHLQSKRSEVFRAIAQEARRKLKKGMKKLNYQYH